MQPASINFAHPVASQRFDTMDLARGIALLGVAMINVHAIARGWSSHYALDLATHRADVVVEYLVGLLFAHRAFPTLAFLLGVGIAMQWQRLFAPDSAERSTALRVLRSRYVALALMGLAHAMLLWPGDIVSSYAVIVLVLLWWWPKTSKRLLLWGTLTVLLSLAFYIAIGATYFAISDTGTEPLDPSASSFAQASLAAALAMHPKEFLSAGIVQATLPELWAAIVIGVWAGQTGRFVRWLRGESNASAWFAVSFVLLAIGTALELTASQMGAWSYVPKLGRGDGVMTLGVPLVLVGSVFAWLAISRAWRVDRFQTSRSFIVSAGRTPLTQFFGQSLVFAIVFNDSMIGWHGDMGRAAYSLVALVSFVLLAGFARAWLASGHERGPVEIAWMALATWIERRGQ
jgi:uncharacterized protein